MAIIKASRKLTKKEVEQAREEFTQYIKITADLEQEIVLIGGEYHADAERKLLDDEGARQDNIWGGGYNIANGIYELGAMVNLRPGRNDSVDILDPVVRQRFLKLVRLKLKGIEKLV